MNRAYYLGFNRECRAVARAILPHDRNNDVEKTLLYILVLVWLIMELGIMFLGKTPPDSITWIRYLVLFLFGNIIGLERGREIFAAGGNGGGDSQ